MTLRGVADAVGAGIEQGAQHHAHVVAGAANEEVVGRRSPGFAQPVEVGLEAAAGDHAGAGADGLALAQRRLEDALAQAQAAHLGLVAHLHAQRLRAAVVGIDERLAAPQEEGIGAAQVQGARERLLEAHPVAAHPVAAARGIADGDPGHRLVGEPAGDLEQVLPVLLLGVGLGEHILRRLVHAAQVAGVHGVAAAPLAGRRLQQQHAGAGLAGGDRRAQRGVAAAHHQDIDA
jgi:hypothetical protein